MIFANVIKALEMKRLSWIIQVGSESNSKSSYKRKQKEIWDRKEGSNMTKEADWSSVVKSQMPTTARNRKKQE